MRRRAGITLVEVLVAILITGVGLLALLTLFPLGALEMAQAIKDDRCGHAKHNAAAIANAHDIRSDPTAIAAMLDPSGLMTAPLPGTYGGGLPTFYTLGSVPPAVDPSKGEFQSYPVFIDPVGWWANAANPNWQNWVAGQPGATPRRITYALLGPTSLDPQFLLGGLYRTQQIRRFTTFLDDMNFPRDDPNTPVGRPTQPPTAGGVERTTRFSWAYLCRMPKARASTIVELAVVVYSGRQLDQVAGGETAYTASFAPGSNVVTLSWDPTVQDTPDVTLGGWIFDATMQPDPHGYFYRVVGTNQTGPSTMDVEVQQKLRGFGTANKGVVVIMDSVVEVFERGTF